MKRRSLDEEKRSKSQLNGYVKNLCDELRDAKSELNEERSDKEEMVRSLAKAGEEVRFWKVKLETESSEREEIIEENRRKWELKIQELQTELEVSLGKCSSLDVNRQHLKNQVEDLELAVERAMSNGVVMDKKMKQMDKVVGDWQARCCERENEVIRIEKELREAMVEIGRLKNDVVRSEVEFLLRVEWKRL